MKNKKNKKEKEKIYKTDITVHLIFHLAELLATKRSEMQK